MGIITEISLQRKNKSRVNLYIDGEFFTGLDLFTAQLHRLKVGVSVSEEEISRIVFDSECASAFEKSAELINIRMRSEKEIRAYLEEKAYSEPVIERTVVKLKEYKLADDAKFAGLYVASYRERWGIKKIEFELKRLGIDSGLICEALEELSDQSEDAYRLALRRQGKSRMFDKRKTYAYLAQKGFSSDAIETAVARLGEELAQNGSDE